MSLTRHETNSTTKGLITTLVVALLIVANIFIFCKIFFGGNDSRVVTSASLGERVEIELPSNYEEMVGHDGKENGQHLLTYRSTKGEIVSVTYPDVGKPIDWIPPNPETP